MVMAFGTWLRRRRRALDLTQAELAEQIGCTPISLRKIEAEERRPSVELVGRLANRLGIGPEQQAAFIQFARGDPWAGQAFEASAPAGALGPAAQLPAPLTPFIGRAREAAAVRRQLRQGDCRLLSLLGPAGIGKTRLALAAAARLAADGVFGGGVFFVPLASIDDPQLFWPAIAQAVGLREAGQQPLREALGHALRQRPVLLVLDNLEQILEAAAGLPELLGQCPHLKILATSREPLRVYGEQRFPVPLLALPAAGQQPALRELKRFSAIALFVARVQAVRPDFVLGVENAPAVTGICARLDGLPLALELIAARMDRLSATGMLAELDPPAPVAGRSVPLHTDGLQGLPERQRTLYNALDWSYQRLPGFEQRLFVRLAAFAGGCTLEAAQIVCAEPEPEVAAGLAALADKSLLRHEAGEAAPADSKPARPARYNMLVTVQAYARERLEESGEAESVQQRHADYYLRLTEAAAPELAGPRQVEWLDRLDGEKANLQTALRQSLDRAAPDQALRLSIALFRFWQMRGYWTEGRQWLNQALAGGPAEKVGPVLRARALNNAGSLAGMQGEFEAADGFFGEGLTLFRAADDRRGTMVMLGNLGLVARNQGDYARAAALHQESLVLARELEAVPNIAHALNNLGLVCNAQGELAQAERYLSESLSLHRQVGNRHDIAGSLQAIGETRLRLGRTGEAEDAFRESLQLQAELHGGLAYSGALAGLAAVAAAQGQAERAARLIGAVEHLREAMGTPMLPVDRVLYENALERLRPRQAEPGVAAAWEEGRRLTWEQAAACGLETGRVKRLRRLVPYLVLAGLWALFFWRFAAPEPSDRVSYVAGDFSQQFGVFRHIIYRDALEGRLSIWADCLDAGYPFYADPQAQLFYPPVWLVMAGLWMQGWRHYPIEALVAEAAGHYLLCSWLMFAFLRSLRLRPGAALLGSVVFTYGGYLTGSPPLQTATLEVDTWLPLALLAAGRLAQTRRLGWLAVTAAALTLAFLAGHPQTFVYVALLTGGYLIFRARQAGWRWTNLAAVGAGLAALTTGLSAAQLLPSLHFILGYSTRGGLPFAQAGHGFPFQDVAQFIVPGLVSYWSPLYVGMLPLGLAALALKGRGGEIRFWAGVAGVGLVLSFGAKAAAYDAVYWLIPGMRLFRGQEHLALVVSLALAVLAAHGAQALFGSLDRGSRRAFGWLVGASGWGLAAAGALLVVVLYAARLGLGRTEGQAVVDGLGRLVFTGGLAFAALAARARVPALRRALPALFVAVTALDLFAVGRPLNVVPAFDPYPHNPLLTAIYEAPGFFRVQDDGQLAGHAGCAYGYRAVEGVTPYRLGTYEAFTRLAPEAVRWRLLGVGYVVSWRAELFGRDGTAPLPTEITARGTAPDERGNFTTVHRLPDAPRRAFLAQRVITATDEAAIYTALRAEDFVPETTVVLGTEIETGGGGAVAVVSDTPGRVELAVDSAGPNVLVFSESYFPGWAASVDGSLVPVLRADGALMAVAVPGGAHRVTFEFRPRVLAWGWTVSVLALGALAGLVWYAWRTRRRKWDSN